MDWSIPATIRLSSDAKVLEASDAELIRSIADGDQRALEALFVRHNLKIFRFIARLVRDKSLAENLVSEVFLGVWREAAKFQGHPRISTWLLVLARDEALAALGRPQSKELGDRFADIAEDPADNPKLVVLKEKRISLLFPGRHGIVGRASRHHRPCLLPPPIDRRSRADSWHRSEHGEDAHVQCQKAHEGTLFESTCLHSLGQLNVGFGIHPDMP